MRSWVLAVCVLLLFGCGSRRPVVRLSAPNQFELAKREFDSKRYERALEGFKKIIFEHPGSDLVDDAQYYLAESYFLMNDYVEAREEYRFLLDNLPQSPYRDEALFKLGVCYYKSSPSYPLNQAQTRKALEIFEEFSARFPESELLPEVEEYRRSALERLAKKQLEAGRLYVRMGRYSSAEVYLKDGIKSFPNSKHYREFYLLLGECYQKEGRAEEALQAYRQIANGADEFSSAAKKRLRELEEGK